MIASVVVTLEPDSRPVQEVLDEMALLPEVEVGDSTSHPRRVPLTIDSSDPDGLEIVTRRLEECPGVMFVDVVFVHFDDQVGNQHETQPGRQTNE